MPRERDLLEKLNSIVARSQAAFTSIVYTQIMDQNDVKWRRMQQSDKVIAERNGLKYENSRCEEDAS